ncbi:MAG: hypothetical protein HXY46_00675 [Syntrophaceae bacterium]|nr:hypothetical protein [Syntrophaceae bacterium]
MAEIKGTALIDTIKGIKDRYGDQIYKSIVDQLKGEARGLFERSLILPSGWYSLDAFAQFLETYLKVAVQGNEQELIKRSEVLIERQLSGIYKWFVKLGSPEFVLNRISAVHRTYFQGVGVEVNLPSPGKAILKYTGFAKQHRLIGLIIIGFYRKALEISGAKEVKAEFTSPIEDDRGYCELLLSWRGK